MVGLGVDTKDLSKVRGTCIEGYKEIEAGNIFGQRQKVPLKNLIAVKTLWTR